MFVWKYITSLPPLLPNSYEKIMLKFGQKVKIDFSKIGYDIKVWPQYEKEMLKTIDKKNAIIIDIQSFGANGYGYNLMIEGYEKNIQWYDWWFGEDVLLPLERPKQMDIE